VTIAMVNEYSCFYSGNNNNSTIFTMARVKIVLFIYYRSEVNSKKYVIHYYLHNIILMYFTSVLLFHRNGQIDWFIHKFLRFAFPD
jgi:lipopolysaccharide export LptBFGC system permease protein LptF